MQTMDVNETAWQRFLETGPLALLPVRDGYSNIVWSTTPQHAAELESSSPEHLAAAVNEARPLLSIPGAILAVCIYNASCSAHGTLPQNVAYSATHVWTFQRQADAVCIGMQAFTGGTTPPRNPFLIRGPSEDFKPVPAVLPVPGAPRPRSFPLALQAAGKYTRPRLALAGDAAHSVHPLAGQGANLGLGDVAALVDMLAHAVERGRDLGELALLEVWSTSPSSNAYWNFESVLAAALLRGPPSHYANDLPSWLENVAQRASKCDADSVVFIAGTL